MQSQLWGPRSPEVQKVPPERYQHPPQPAGRCRLIISQVSARICTRVWNASEAMRALAATGARRMKRSFWSATSTRCSQHRGRGLIWSQFCSARAYLPDQRRRLQSQAIPARAAEEF